MKTELQKINKQINEIKNKFIEKIKQLPDNPEINRLNQNCYIMKSGQLTKHDDWSSFFHDFKKQYKYIIALTEANSNKKSIDMVINKLTTIVEKGCIKDTTFHPDVRKELKRILE